MRSPSPTRSTAQTRGASGYKDGLGVRSAALKVRFALLGKRPRALLGILSAENGHADLALQRERAVLGHALGVPDRGRDRLDGYRAIGGNQVRDLQGLRQRLPVVDDIADEPDPQSLAGRDVPAG